MTSLDLRENIAALAIAMLNKKVRTVEDAFELLENGKIGSNKIGVSTELLIEMRASGMKRRDIADATGMRAGTISERFRRHNKLLREMKH